MNLLNKTFLPTKNFETRNWFIIDCKEQKLGRLATIIVELLKGRKKPHYYPSIDVGDHVILINANLTIFNKNNKHYIVFNPGRPGNSLKIKKIFDCFPKFTIKCAVKRMLSKTERKKVMRRLYIYNEENHCHQSQNLIKINISNFYSNHKFNNKLNF